MDSNEPAHGVGGRLGAVAGRSDTGKAILHTIDPMFIHGIGQISEFGSRKYHMRNFLMAPGMRWSQVYDSLMRHLMLWWAGEERDVGPNGEFGETDDPETNMKWSGLPHLWHIGWNVMVLSTYAQHAVYAGGDDRPSKVEQAGAKWQDWKESFDEERGIEQSAPVLSKEEAHAKMFHDALDAALANSEVFIDWNKDNHITGFRFEEKD